MIGHFERSNQSSLTIKVGNSGLENWTFCLHIKNSELKSFLKMKVENSETLEL